MTALQSPSPITRTRAWRIAIRPKTLPAAVGPVLVGTGLAAADGAFALLPALAALAGALLLQIAVNLANDYFDFLRGVDTAERLGPPRAAASGLISPAELRIGLGAVIGVSLLIGIYLVIVGGLPILLIGTASVLAALAYSGGPFPLASNGLGDLFVFIFFGIVAVVGTYYVQALTATPLAYAASVPVGALITAIIVVNNYRDLNTDRKVGKRTLAVLLGARATRIEFAALISFAYFVPPLLWLVLGLSTFPLLLPLISMPMAVQCVREFHATPISPALNKLLAKTARLSLIFSLLFAVGLLLHSIF